MIHLPGPCHCPHAPHATQGKADPFFSTAIWKNSQATSHTSQSLCQQVWEQTDACCQEEWPPRIQGEYAENGQLLGKKPHSVSRLLHRPYRYVHTNNSVRQALSLGTRKDSAPTTAEKQGLGGTPGGHLIQTSAQRWAIFKAAAILAICLPQWRGQLPARPGWAWCLPKRSRKPCEAMLAATGHSQNQEPSHSFPA